MNTETEHNPEPPIALTETFGALTQTTSDWNTAALLLHKYQALALRLADRLAIDGQATPATVQTIEELEKLIEETPEVAQCEELSRYKEATRNANVGRYATRTPISSPEHNPDNLSPEQYEAPEWRLLRKDEDVIDGDESFSEYRLKHKGNAWAVHEHGPSVKWQRVTYRRRVTPIPATGGEKGEVRLDYPKHCATCRNYNADFCQLRGDEAPRGSTARLWPKCERLDWCGKHEVESEMHCFVNNRRLDYDASKEPLTVSQARASLLAEIAQRKIFWEHDLSKPLDELILIPKGASVVALPEAYPS